MESLDEIVEILREDPELQKRETRDEKLRYVQPRLCLKNDLEELYVTSKLGLTCPHLSVDPYAADPSKKYCDDGFKTPTNCTGSREEECGWYNTRFLVDELKDKLSDDELDLYYFIWIRDIADNYDEPRIVAHLKKHLKEDRSGRWFASAQNLMNIYGIVGDMGNPHKAFRKTQKILKGYEGDITTEQKLYGLLNHYRKHLQHFMSRENIVTKWPLVERVKEINAEYRKLGS
jgi:hypothetical protein